MRNIIRHMRLPFANKDVFDLLFCISWKIKLVNTHANMHSDNIKPIWLGPQIAPVRLTIPQLAITLRNF